jgi:CRISPR-associated endonuclease/helicase Cas3
MTTLESSRAVIYYARTLLGQPEESWQKLEVHLTGVSRRAAGFASAFDSQEWGQCAGLWHDLGKYRDEFQKKLRGERISAEHSGVGAALVFDRDGSRNKEIGLPLAFAIAGHHAGLANWNTSDAGLPKSLKERLKDNTPIYRALLSIVSNDIVGHPLPGEQPPFLRFKTLHNDNLEDQQRHTEFWVRFLFSALVDADRLDSEVFCDAQKACSRSQYPPPGVLSDRLDAFIAGIQSSIALQSRNLVVNSMRALVLSFCKEAATQPQGIFTLTVPTGGGKTLSAMSFALRHAKRHGLRRIIVVIPYTSIIEQNADVYRKALGNDAVVEHHANLDPRTRRTALGEDVASRAELACDNWDAPIIVTTTVQFFESLFSNRPSRCRKLHNIARSVIVLDEVQTLPPEFLNCILDGLNELIRAYHCSAVLATATPPALKWRAGFNHGLRNCYDIVADPSLLASKLQRVTYDWPNESERWSIVELAARLSAHQQVLAVVHRRQDARDTAQKLEKLVHGDSVRHLSALMCPAHRSQVLQEIKDLLKQGAACRVVSTQLVEAGVDLDFPIVYRALGGLDSVVQAAGRCNREGQLNKEQAKVIIFRAESLPPRGTPRKALEITEGLLKEHGEILDPENPQLFEAYFRGLYFVHDTDKKNIQNLRARFQFASVASEFRLIEDDFTKTVVAPFGDALLRLEELRRFGPSRERYRALQPFTVNIYPDAFQRLLNDGALEEIVESSFRKNSGTICMFTLTVPFRHLYSMRYGLVMGDEVSPAVEALMV